MKSKKGRKVLLMDINPDILQKWIDEDQNRKTALKCQALIALTNGVKLNQVCQVLNVTRESVRIWRNEITEKGHEYFLSIRKKGKISLLTENIQENIKKIICQSPEKLGYQCNVWDGKTLSDYLSDKWNIQISIRTAQLWLSKLNLRSQKRIRIKFP